MLVNSALNRLSPAYGLRSGSNSQAAKSAAAAKELPEKTFTTGVDGAAQAASIPSGATADDDQLQSTLASARRQSGATAESPTDEASESPAGRPSAGIALYERVSQYDNNNPSTSTLLKSWNDIMQGGQDAEGAVAAFAKALSQNATLGSESGILDVTA